MDLFLGLASLLALSLFFARLLGRSSALMPLVSVSAAMLWFSLMGCFNLLLAAGIIWYAACATALGWVIYKERQNIARLFTPGLLFFAVGGAFFILLFFFTRPLLTEWDDFIKLGTAAKTVTETGQMYTVAPGNLTVTSFTPGLVVFSYMMQFFGGSFAEYKYIAALALVYLAAFAVPSAFFKKNRAAALAFLGGLFLLPFFFELARPAGLMSWSYLSGMADGPMAAMFGGAICYYYAGGTAGPGARRPKGADHKTLLPLGAILAALTNLKDMGLALALIVWMVVCLDMLFCERKRLRFFRLGNWGAFLAAAGTLLLCIAAAYLGWALHLRYAPAGVDRFDVGNAAGSLTQTQMLAAGVLALLGIQKNAHFDVIFALMRDALFSRPVSVIGPGAAVLVLSILLTAGLWLLSGSRPQRKRVLFFAGSMTAGFLTFYIFNIFTYAFIFKEVESLGLASYHRYIYPYWFGWLMACLALLAGAAGTLGASRLRGQAARLASLGCTLLLVLSALFRGGWQANFMHVSPSLYGQRQSVQQVVELARQQGMADEDVVYILSQGDDGTRFYLFGYEMAARRVPLYAIRRDADNRPVTGPNGQPVLLPNVASALVPHSEQEISGYQYPVGCTPEELAAYLQEAGCTHLLIDTPDEYILEAFSPRFADNLAGWSVANGLQRGHSYYRIAWQGGNFRFIPCEGGGEA